MPKPRRLHDAYFKQAKAEGYLARSAYKLKEIQERHTIIKPGDFVLDLGCAPGSWLQVAGELVGSRGLVVGIDLKESDPRVPSDTVVTLVGDTFATSAERLLEPARARDATRRFDVVLSDMAPSTSGHGDDLVSSRLCRGVLELVPKVLRVGGWLAMKIFEGAEYSAVLEETAGLFGNAKGLKPRATREISREMYIIGIGFRGAEGKAPPTARIGAPPSPRAGWS